MAHDLQWHRASISHTATPQTSLDPWLPAFEVKRSQSLARTTYIYCDGLSPHQSHKPQDAHTASRSDMLYCSRIYEPRVDRISCKRGTCNHRIGRMSGSLFNAELVVAAVNSTPSR